LAVLATLSWTPKAYMVRTGYSGLFEHAVAYAGTAVLFRFSYPSFSRWRLAALLATYAGILEAGQAWIPGRGASIVDWGAGAAGSLIASRLWRRSLQIHMERRFWLYVGPDLFRNGQVMIAGGWGYRPDAASDEVVWRRSWEWRLGLS
jgi:hypothetical protein